MKKIITCILTLVLLVTPIVSLAAAPAAASFLEGPANVELGKEFEVTYYLQGDEVRAANGLVSFNTSRLEVVSASLDVSGWILESENVMIHFSDEWIPEMVSKDIKEDNGHF